MLITTIKTARRVAIAIIGGTVVLLGLVMIVLPGPAILVIPAGLAILGTEFAWARWLLKRIRARTNAIIQSVRRTGKPEVRAGEAEPTPLTAVRTFQPAD